MIPCRDCGRLVAVDPIGERTEARCGHCGLAATEGNAAFSGLRLTALMMLALLALACGVVALSGCAAVKPIARTVHDAATILCESAPGVQAAAERQGISVQELCAVHDVLAPFLDEALRAQRAAASRAGMARP